MKPINLLLIFLCTFSYAKSQDHGRTIKYNLQLHAGMSTFVKGADNFAYGASAKILKPINKRIYFSTGVKAISNPYENGPLSLFKNGFNVKGDALNYFMALAGLRFAINKNDVGYVYAEPRAGIAFANGFAWTGFGISPSFGCQIKSFDVSVFLDGGFSGKNLNSKKQTFITTGVGLGITF
jgi:hypothetical protein